MCNQRAGHRSDVVQSGVSEYLVYSQMKILEGVEQHQHCALCCVPQALPELFFGRGREHRSVGEPFLGVCTSFQQDDLQGALS